MSHRILPDGRMATIVPADEAGEFLLSAAEGLLMHLAGTDYFTRRQLDAAAELARLYGLGGGRSPWRRTGGQGRAEEAVAAARAEFAMLLDCAPVMCRASVLALAMGEWPDPTSASRPVPLLRDGWDAVADRLKLARD